MNCWSPTPPKTMAITTTRLIVITRCLARDGVRADWHFQIGELFVPMAKRSRHGNATTRRSKSIRDFVEARSSLAGVLAETGQISKLSVAAYQATLALHDDYPRRALQPGPAARSKCDAVRKRHSAWRRSWNSPPAARGDEARGRLDEGPVERDASSQRRR